jgi:hippurate hydrolase
MKLLDSIATEAASIIAVRRDIHAHPELCFQEQRTADVVAGKLTEWGIRSAPRHGHHRRGRCVIQNGN